MICRECGKNIEENKICPFCGAKYAEDAENGLYTFAEYRERIALENVYKREDIPGDKSALCAAVLQLFCGVIGLGRFYMGYKTIGIFQIIFSLLTCGIGGVLWGFCDGILILTGKVKYDADGKLLI